MTEATNKPLTDHSSDTMLGNEGILKVVLYIFIHHTLFIDPCRHSNLIYCQNFCN